MKLLRAKRLTGPLASVLFLAASTFGYGQADPPRIVLPPGELVPTRLIAADALAAGPDWGVVALKAPDAWARTKGRGVTAAVLDTGAPNHPDLVVKAQKDFTGSRSGSRDAQGHSTHCCGTIAARGKLPGVAPEADLIAGKVLDDGGSGGVDGIAKGITWAVDQGADVISMSLGGPARDSFIPPALDYAESKGVIVVAAAGNEGPREGTVGYPGGYAKSLAVAAVNAGKLVAGFSSRGPAVFVAAPGVAVKSTYLNGQYATMDGTSMATPHVAGLACLWVAAHPEVPKADRPKRFREALQAACTDLPPSGRDTASGYGFPDAVKLTEPASVPPVQPPTNPSLEDRVKELERRVGELEKRFSEPVPVPMPEVTNDDRWRELVARVKSTGRRELFGIGPNTTFTNIYPAGYLGYKAGVYEMFRHETGDAYVREWQPAPAATPQVYQFPPFGLAPANCPGGTCYQRR